MRSMFFALPLTLVACELVPVDTAGDSGLDSGTIPTDDGEPGGGGGGGGGGGQVESDGWVFSTHPCFGNRTDVMWFDSRDRVWVGCGSTTEGKGLFHSEDGGASWSSAGTFFDQYRVSSLQRVDGLLYVAGIDTTSALRVVTLADDGTITEVFSAGDQIWNSFHVGGFRRNSEGLMVAESLTSTGLVVRDGDAADWRDADGWWGGGSEGFQLLDLVVHDDQFYGVGSTISQPPYVYLPPEGGQSGDAFGFDIMELSSGPAPFDGELWGIDVDDSGLIVGGVDQDHDAGMVFWTGADPWAGVDGLEVTSFLGGGDPTWVRGVCRDGATMVAVGEYSRKGTGFVLRSLDGGSTWDDLTPGELPPVSKCELFADGELVVSGAEGLFASLR